jgi:diguanylate cyclase (GGDEF)-like protein
MRTALHRPVPLLLAALLLAAAPAVAQRPAQGPPPPPTGRELMAEAERLERAGDDGAAEAVERALPLLTAPADRALRLKALGMQCWGRAAVVEPDSLVALASRGMAEAQRAGDAREHANLRTCRGYGLENAGRVNEAAADYEAAVAEGRRLRDDRLLAAGLMFRGELRYYRGDMGAALADLTESHELYKRLGSESRQRHTLNDIANLYADRRVGEYDKAIEYYRQVLASNQAAGNQAGISTAYFNLGTTLDTKGESAAALPYFRRSLEIERKRGDSTEIAFVQRAMGAALTRAGQPAEALRWLDASLAYSVRTGDVDGASRTRLPRAVALRTLGRPAEALAELAAARPYFESTDNTRFLEKLHDERALSLAATGDWRGAYEARGTQMRMQAALAEQLKQEHTSRLRVQFDTERKEAENRALVRENGLRGQALAAAARVRRLQTVVIALSAGIMVILAVLIARHVANARLLRTMAMTDELTRLPNRRHLFAVAGARLNDAGRKGEPVSVLALDVDHFKRINDTFGHDVGDAVLLRVAQACRSALRHDDHIGRTGGEEFVAVLPHADAAHALEVAERLRAAVESLDWSGVDPALRVTVSVGVAQRTDADDFAALAKRADDSLYRAKHAGRNRVEVAAV